MPLLDHLAELRDRIVKIAVAVALGALVAWFLYPQIFDILLEAVLRPAGRLGRATARCSRPSRSRASRSGSR